MDCEQVFAVLTRGPFPTGTRVDAAVAAHLALCPSCGRLAEALRPADEPADPSVDPRELSSLPGYYVPPQAGGRKAQTLRTLQTSRAAPGLVEYLPSIITVGAPRIRPAHLVLAVALGVAAGIAVFAAFGPRRSNESLRLLTGPVVHKTSREVPFTSPPLARQCFAAEAGSEGQRPTEQSSRDVSPAPLANAGGLPKPNLGVQCCTKCHRSGSPLRVSLAANSTVTQSCRSCHLD